MDIRLAGYNVEQDLLKEIDTQGRITGPEVFSAAYARISRSSKTIAELRTEARRDINKARKSNEKIIFGMGHHSVAEHAVFNFDLMGISRLALEAVEQFRLVSYTEKSQRYVTIGEDWVMPQEIVSAGLKEPFTVLVDEMHRFYRESVSCLYDRLCHQFGHPSKKAEKNDLECRAKEDARYALPMATAGQVGMTINARNLEHMMRRLHLSPLDEVRLIGRKLYELVEHIAPSLILFPHPSRFESRLAQFASTVEPQQSSQNATDPFELSFTELPAGGDDAVLVLLLTSRDHLPHAMAREQVNRMSLEEKRSIFTGLFQDMDFFDAPPRHFEFISITFEALISSSCFAQIKRHRMASLLVGPYHPILGYTIPPQLKEAGLDDRFQDLMQKVHSFFHQHREVLGPAAQYALTNAHRRRVTMRFNLRDLYHFIRLRADTHAQWEIRDLALAVEEKVRKELPLTGMMLAGKDHFPARYEALTI